MVKESTGNNENKIKNQIRKNDKAEPKKFKKIVKNKEKSELSLLYTAVLANMKDKRSTHKEKLNDSFDKANVLFKADKKQAFEN